MITILNMYDPVYVSEDHNLVDLMIETKEHGVIPTTINLSSSEQEPHVLEIKKWLKTCDISPFVPAALTLEEVKRNKGAYIRKMFASDSIEPVLHNGITYNGGIDSVYRLDGALRLAEKAGLAEVTFTDINNIAHVHTIAEANAVILATGLAFQTKFMNKQSKLVEIENALTVDEVNLITY